MFPLTISSELFSIENDASSRGSQEQQQLVADICLRSQERSWMRVSAMAAVARSATMNSPSLTSLSFQHQYEIDLQKRIAAHAFASRDQSTALQHQQQQDFMLKRAIFERAASGNDGLAANRNCQEQKIHYDLSRRRCSNSMYCAEQDLSPQKDICFGRGQRVQRREANVAFRKIVAEYQEMYDRAESRERKKNVVMQVSRAFATRGYRFFKESEKKLSTGDGSKIWIAVPDSDVEYKISHSFRSGRKILKREHRNKQKLKKKDEQARDCNATVNNGESNKIIHSEDEDSEEENSHEHCLRETDILEIDVCVGVKRAHSTKLNASNYDHFREFVGTFKSLYEMSKSAIEKEKIVSSIIQKIKDQKGYRLEASMNDLVKEIRSILCDKIQERPSERTVTQQSINNNRMPVNVEQNDRKRSSSICHSNSRDTDNHTPQKRQRLSQRKERPHSIDSATVCLPTVRTKRVVSSCTTSSTALVSSDRNVAPNSCDDESLREAPPSFRQQASITANMADIIASKQRLMATSSACRDFSNGCGNVRRVGIPPTVKLLSVNDPPPNDMFSFCSNNSGVATVLKENHIARYVRERGLITRVAKERKQLLEWRRPSDPRFDIDSVYLEGLTLKNEKGLCLTGFEIAWLERMEQDQRAALLQKDESIPGGDSRFDLNRSSLEQQVMTRRSSNGWSINTTATGIGRASVDRFAIEANLLELQRLEQREMEQKQLLAIIDMKMRSLDANARHSS